MKTVACITTRNEESSIGSLVKDLLNSGLVQKVVVTDARSSDDTLYKAKEAGAEAYDVGIASIALGQVIAWGFALDSGADRVVTLDAGGSHSVRDLKTILDAMDDTTDLVVGSRFLPESVYEGRPWRKTLSRWAAHLCNCALIGHIGTDWTSGYRCYTRQALQDIACVDYRAKMHARQIEILKIAADRGLRIKEVPISYKAGRSSMSFYNAFEAYVIWTRLFE